MQIRQAKAAKTAIYSDSSYFMLLSIWDRQSLHCENLPRKTMHQTSKRFVPIFLPSAELHICWDSPEFNPGILNYFFLISFFNVIFFSPTVHFPQKKAVGRCRAAFLRYTSIWLTSEVWIIPLANTTSLFSHSHSGTPLIKGFWGCLLKNN